MKEDSLTPSNPTTIGSWALLVAKAIDSYGLDSKAIFVNAGVDIETLHTPNARIPRAQMANIWQQARNLSGDPYISLRVAQEFKPTVFSALGMALAASSHVLDALKRISKYSQLIADTAQTTIDEYDDEIILTVIRLRPNIGPFYDLGAEAIFASLVSLLRAIAGEGFAPKKVEFGHESDVNIAPYEEFFGCPIFFGMNEYRVTFDKKHVMDEHAFSNSSITSMLDNWMEEHLAQFNEDLVATKVQKYIMKHLMDGDIDQKKIAKELALGPRTLQIKLKEEGTSYTKLLDDCRHKLAIKLINLNKMELSEVAFILGFSDQANFSRAFKRWTGTTPKRYKQT